MNEEWASSRKWVVSSINETKEKIWSLEERMRAIEVATALLVQRMALYGVISGVVTGVIVSIVTALLIRWWVP